MAELDRFSFCVCVYLSNCVPYCKAITRCVFGLNVLRVFTFDDILDSSNVEAWSY